MQKFYKWFDIFLNVLLASPLILGIIAFCITEFFPLPLPLSPEIIFGATSTFILLLAFLFSVIYDITGIITLIIGVRNKEKVTSSRGKRLLIKGLIKGFIAFLIFLILSLVLSFFGLSSGTLVIPSTTYVTDPNGSQSGFPLNDLQIINKKSIKGDASGCEITVKNNNSTLSAANINVYLGTTDNIDANGLKHIAPGKTLTFTVEETSGGSFAGPCADVTLYAAGTVAKGK